MGQYYRPILANESETHRTIYNRDLDGEYTMAKLMEHSWWLNPFVCTICSKLYRKKKRVAWVGDYANGYADYGLTPEDESHVNLSSQKCKELHKSAWKGKGIGIKSDLLYLDHRFLVNHSKKEYLDCDEYFEKANQHGWCVHPLPLLTAIGNGFGGGDYHGVNENVVGVWANDIISIEDDPGNYTKIDTFFAENF